MRPKTYIRQKTYHCGKQNKKSNYLEVDIFEYTETTKQAKKKQETMTAPKQQNLNEKNAKRYFGLLVKSNFDNNDFHIVLTYDKDPEDIVQAEKEMKKYIDRLRTLYKKYGKENVDYIYVTEQSTKGKIHHHLLLKDTGISRDKIEEKWRNGYANSRRIRADEKGIEKLTSYMQKDAKGKKRWKNSQNLVRPWITTKDGAISRRKVDKLATMPPDCQEVKEYWERQYPEYELYECQHYFNQVTAKWSIYLKLKLRRRYHDLSSLRKRQLTQSKLRNL